MKGRQNGYWMKYAHSLPKGEPYRELMRRTAKAAGVRRQRICALTRCLVAELGELILA